MTRCPSRQLYLESIYMPWKRLGPVCISISLHQKGGDAEVQREGLNYSRTMGLVDIKLLTGRRLVGSSANAVVVKLCREQLRLER